MNIYNNTYEYHISGRMPEFVIKILKQKHQTINCGNDYISNGFLKNLCIHCVAIRGDNSVLHKFSIIWQIIENKINGSLCRVYGLYFESIIKIIIMKCRSELAVEGSYYWGHIYIGMFINQ